MLMESVDQELTVQGQDTVLIHWTNINREDLKINGLRLAISGE